MPDDLHLYVRTMADVPMTLKDEFEQILKEHDWKETVIPDPTLLPRMVRKMKE
jgi:acetyl-CoA decarbonylase/synthase complex subunit alpha